MSKKKKLSNQELNLKKQNRLNEAERLGIIGMIESGTPIREVARQSGRSVQTIWKLKENAKSPLPPVENIKKRLSGKMWVRIDKAEDLLNDKLDTMSGFQLAGAIHLGVQDARLMYEQSTVNIAQIIGLDPELRSGILALNSKNKQIGSAQINLNSGDNQRDNNESSGQD